MEYFLAEFLEPLSGNSAGVLSFFAAEFDSQPAFELERLLRDDLVERIREYFVSPDAEVDRVVRLALPFDVLLEVVLLVVEVQNFRELLR